MKSVHRKLFIELILSQQLMIVVEMDYTQIWCIHNTKHAFYGSGKMKMKTKKANQLLEE